jgi:hypothetical protein
MSEFKIFIGFFVSALKAIPKNISAVTFGSLLTLGSSEYFFTLFKSGAPLERYQLEVTTALTEQPALFLIIPIVIAIATFAKGGLIVALSEKKSNVKSAAKKTSALFPKLYALEAIFLISCFVILAALLFPAILVQDNSSLAINLAFLGLVIFLPVLLVLTFVEIYALFHIILSGTSLRSSIELGYTLFMKRTATSIIFGATSLLMLIAVSLFAGICLGIGNAFIPDSIGRIVVIMLFLFLIQTILSIVQKGAWLSFFLFIGMEKTEPEAASQKQENMIQREVPEIG